MIDKLKTIWEQDKMMIIAGAVLLLGPSIISGRGRPPKMFSIMQFAGLGIVAYVVYKNRNTILG